MRTIRHLASWWGAATLAAALLPGHTAPAATLRWKLKPGDAFHYVMEQKTVTTPTQEGKTLGPISTSFTVNLTRTVNSVADDGTAEMTQRFDRVRMKYEAGLLKVEYDSTKETDPTSAPLVEPLRAMVGAEFTFRMTPRGEMSDVRVPPSVVKSFKEAGARGGASEPFSEEGFKNSLIQTSVTFPAEDLRPGKSWSRQVKIPTPGGAAILQTRTYTFEGPAEQAGAAVEKIGITSKVEPPADKTAPEMPEIKRQECHGALYFDSRAGHMVSSEVVEKTDTSIKIMDKVIDLAVSQTTTMTLAPAEEPSK